MGFFTPTYICSTCLFLGHSLLASTFAFQIAPPLLISTSRTQNNINIVVPVLLPLLLTPSSLKSSDFTGTRKRSTNSALHATRDLEENGDWRSFRANLVSNERQRKQKHQQEEEQRQCHNSPEPAHNDQFVMEDCKSIAERNKSWIYDSGHNIETGTVLLNNPYPWTTRAAASGDIDINTNTFRYGLSQQWLHKSVVLILEHDQFDPNCETTGILLNRPTDLILQERNPIGDHVDMGRDGSDSDKDDDQDQGWKIWFGGEEFGIHGLNPKFFCLHSLGTDICMGMGMDTDTDSTDASHLQLQSRSSQVIPGMYFCSLQDAREMVVQGDAKRDDFWVFSGFQTWDHRQLEHDLKEGIWHAISTDANLVNKGHDLLNSAAGNTDDGHTYYGDRVWKILMRLIGKHQRQHQQQRQELSKGGGPSFCDRMLLEWSKVLDFDGPPLFARDDDEDENASELIIQNYSIQAGSMIQAAPTCMCSENNLMSDQQFHQSTILILQDDEEMTIGVMLNVPSSISLDLWMNSEEESLQDTVSVPLRYGGPLGSPPCDVDYCDVCEPLFSLHMNPDLRRANIGEPIGDNDKNGIWKCTFEELTGAIHEGLAFVEDFFVVDGICVWNKEVDENGNLVCGILKEIQHGRFHIVSSSRIEQVWHNLSSMEVLTTYNIDKIMAIGEEAWKLGNQELTSVDEKKKRSLHDEALKHWMEVFLLGKMRNDIAT